MILEVDGSEDHVVAVCGWVVVVVVWEIAVGGVFVRTGDTEGGDGHGREGRWRRCFNRWGDDSECGGGLDDDRVAFIIIRMTEEDDRGSSSSSCY